MLLTMGQDWKWWFLPTRPVLKYNLLERLFTVRELKKLKVFEEDDSDPDRKFLAIER